MALLQYHAPTAGSAFSTDGKRVASGSSDGEIRIWDAGAPDLSRTFAHQADVYAVAFSNDGHTLAAGTDTGDIVLWDAVSGERRHRLSGHRSRIRFLVFDPSYPRLASVSDEPTVAIWDATFGRLLKVLGPYPRPVSAVAFNSEGTQLATATLDGVPRRNTFPVAFRYTSPRRDRRPPGRLRGPRMWVGGLLGGLDGNS